MESNLFSNCSRRSRNLRFVYDRKPPARTSAAGSSPSSSEPDHTQVIPYVIVPKRKMGKKQKPKHSCGFESTSRGPDNKPFNMETELLELLVHFRMQRESPHGERISTEVRNASQGLDSKCHSKDKNTTSRTMSNSKCKRLGASKSNISLPNGVGSIPVALVPSSGGFIGLNNPKAIQVGLQAMTPHFQLISDVRQFGRGGLVCRSSDPSCVSDILKCKTFASVPQGRSQRLDGSEGYHGFLPWPEISHRDHPIRHQSSHCPLVIRNFPHLDARQSKNYVRFPLHQHPSQCLRCIGDHSHIDPKLKSSLFPSNSSKKSRLKPHPLRRSPSNSRQKIRENIRTFPIEQTPRLAPTRRQTPLSLSHKTEGKARAQPIGPTPRPLFVSHRESSESRPKEEEKQRTIPISPKSWRIPSIDKSFTKSALRHPVPECHGRTGLEKQLPAARQDFESRPSSHIAPAAKSKAED
ncbi:hypothetical protein HPB51_024895 [Rhipicephalus microplus]|uniref:Uncharacterized protein n=1 Tax=Rhipicephalus microplus TaxID=6941 RepID=A0A9J6EPL3_RHIMP|nr:hypothetical protein HPB51_024895 [Rhipicephalus microplus]